jgi:flagellar biosynthesis/type III secretory pathway chaperone
MTVDQYSECALILKQEIELLEQIRTLQDQVKNAVTNRQWTDFEAHLGSLAAIGDEFEALDLERIEIFTNYAKQLGFNNEGVGFYSFAARLPEAERRELSELYRRIKMKTLEVRFTNDSLTDYLNETQAVVSGFLEEVFPDRRGKIYTRQGTQSSPDMRSMVLNQSL